MSCKSTLLANDLANDYATEELNYLLIACRLAP
jgi:hypothetical protein